MDASRIGYSYAEEAVYATPPSGVAYQNIRTTGGGGWTPTDTLTDSGEVKPTLTRSRPAITQRGADGGVDFEFSDSQQFFDWIAMAISADGANLPATWSTAATTVAAQLDIVDTAGVFTLEGQVGETPFTAINSLIVGQSITLTGFTNANNTFRVAAIDLVSDPQVITLEGTLTAEVGDGDERVGISSVIRNGTTRHSITVLDQRPGVNTYQSFHGQVADSLSLSGQANALLTGSVGFIGAGYSDSALDADDAGNTLGADGAELTGVTFTAAETTSPMQTAENYVVYENDSVISGASCVRGFDINISGRARAQQCVGNMYNSGVGMNILYPELNITRYFTSKALLDQFLSMNETAGYVESFKVSDPAGNTFIFTFPAVFLSGWSLTAASLDADMEAAFSASKAYEYTDATGAKYVMQVDYIPANIFA